MRFYCKFFIVFGLSFVCFPANAQDNLRAQLFGEAEQVMNLAKEKKAELYAPKSFEKALVYYKEADVEYKKGSSIEEIREKIKVAAAYFAKSVDACKQAETTFSRTMASRTDANSAGAPRSFPDLWSRAEEKFHTAALALEDGSMKDAQQQSDEAENIYRTAELEAIKANYLTPARLLLSNADGMGVKENAPKTLEKARRLATQVEVLLKQNRYDTDEARQLAQQAKYEASHAIYLHRTITRMKNEDEKFEDALLSDESQFQQVAGALGFQARFDSGYTKPVTEALAAIKERDSRTGKNADAMLHAAEAIKQKENEVDNLKQQVALMERRLGSLNEAERTLQKNLEVQHQQSDVLRQQDITMQSIASLFTEDEGKVFREGRSVVIRLFGLVFASGKSNLEPQYYSMLTKVQEAISKYPRCKVRIEGHTDSQGRDDVNQTLSEGRANSVAEYLMANSGVELAISHEGYGESRPIASNDTPEGREKNRRIDVVITPESAGR